MTTDPMALWQPVEFPKGTIRTWHIGPLAFRVERENTEWRLCVAREPSAEDRLLMAAPDTDLPGHETSRWVAGADIHRLHLSATLPDRPLVVRPEERLTILPGQRAMFFIGLPLWIRLSTSPDPAGLLCELPTVILSNAWFGLPTEGELCYSLRTTAKRHPEALSRRPYRAVCPLEIRNAAKAPLSFERIRLLVRDLPVYQGAEHVWTAPGRVTYRGVDAWSRVVYGSGPPSFAENAQPVGGPREQAPRGFLAKSFETIKALAEDD
jgi:hypothetical protein